LEWSDRMNAAICYIEDNLADEVDFKKAAEKAFCSLFHFQRMFFVIVGMTPSEYTRRRRLTLAAKELASSGGKVIDIAMKYGYDSPEAFARSFRNIHGINPQAARNSGVKLAAFPRVSFHVELTGGIDMDYRIIEKPAFDLVGKGVQFGVANGEFKDKGRSFFGKYVATKEYQTLCGLTEGKFGMVTGAHVMSGYLPNENGTMDPFINVLGIEKNGSMDTTGFEVFPVPAATYAEFDCTFKTSASTNKRIYSEWFPSTGYERDNKPDIAAFFQVPWCKMIYVRWWIPIIKKSKQ
jgi:AraC family transcriptional regulator